MITLIITLYIIPMMLSIVIAKITKDFDCVIIGLVPVVNMVVIPVLTVNAIEHLLNKLDTLISPLKDWFEK